MADALGAAEAAAGAADAVSAGAGGGSDLLQAPAPNKRKLKSTENRRGTAIMKTSSVRGVWS
jgi:hypothetical protein